MSKLRVLELIFFYFIFYAYIFCTYYLGQKNLKEFLVFDLFDHIHNVQVFQK